MPEFMDVHHHMKGLTAEALKAAHEADLQAQGAENVIFKSAWADPEAGKVFCLSEAPQPKPCCAFTNAPGMLRMKFTASPWRFKLGRARPCRR